MYFREKHGDFLVLAERGKKETRSGNVTQLPLKKFLDIYNRSDLYLVEDILPDNPLAGNY